MKSQTSLVSRNIKLQEWAEMVRDCSARPEDMTVCQLCDEHAITRCDYYYRRREVQKACLEVLPEKVIQQAIVPVPAELMSDSTTRQQKDVTILNSEGLPLHFNGVTIQVKTDTSMELLSRVLEVIAHVKGCCMFQTSIYCLRIYGLSEKNYYSRSFGKTLILSTFSIILLR